MTYLQNEFATPTFERFLIVMGWVGLVLSGADVISDAIHGQDYSHLILESFVFVFFISLIIYSGYRSKSLQSQVKSLEAGLSSAKNSAEVWREESRKYTAGLSAMIYKQFENWNLSSAESDIALLLIKGLSHKEIAVLRGTSERTVRQQALNIYGKANLGGRAELAAYFLEDLLYPQVQQS